MNQIDRKTNPNNKSRVGYIFPVVVFIMLITGISQMPIFKRYYIADIPGFAWLADFYTTLYIHHLGAIILTGLATYVIADYIIGKQNPVKMTPTRYLRTGLLAGIMITGFLLTIKNATAIWFSPTSIVIFNLAHLSLAMIFSMLSMGGLLLKIKRVRTVFPESERKEK